MAIFAEIAPTLSGAGITEAQANTYLDNKPQPPAAPTIPEVTFVKVKAVADAYYVTGIENAGGVYKVAQDQKLLVSQVVALLEEMAAWEAARD